ncbi:MAG TPA: enoyl-CoA hydratase-related protein [Alphaproteobacteria bacterium]|jgi:enoyl-CoA hydratase/carnithine racemase|nr:enoyl-CoA hydratase-related protein [Alphaproteobacteria bacterium]
MNSQPIYLERKAPVARLILNRPDRLNALNDAIWQAIPGLLVEVAADPAIKVLMVSGVDDSAFAAGADIAEFAQIMATGTADAYARRMAFATRALAEFPKPTIAVIAGPCVGGGCSLALCCDFRFAAEGARFGVTPAKLGIAYPLEDTRRLIAAVGISAARDLLMTGRVVTAGAALSLGLIDRCWPAGNLWGEARDYAATLAAGSQYSIRATKAIFGEILAGAVDETDTSRALFAKAFDGEDLKEGAAAFLDKRKPRFTFS